MKSWRERYEEAVNDLDNLTRNRFFCGSSASRLKDFLDDTVIALERVERGQVERMSDHVVRTSEAREGKDE